MKTTATNRKLRLLLTGIRNLTLIPRPEFQRRLVWSNKHKLAFLETVLMEYPFPEIYIAAGEVNPESGEGCEMLVDGQQRITTLYQYFTGSEELKLSKNIKSYSELDDDKKRAFLEYEVVIRDLGLMSIEEIKQVFLRINSTNYSINAMEIHHARYEGEFKAFGEEIATHSIFNNHNIFSSNEVRRMQDLRFVLVFIVTIMSTYFSRDDEIESYLNRYNDEFELKEDLNKEISKVLSFIEKCNFDSQNRVWKKADLFTLLVELHRLLIKEKTALNIDIVKQRLNDFYNQIDSITKIENPASHISVYHKAALQGTNDRRSRIVRGSIIRSVILNTDWEPPK